MNSRRNIVELSKLISEYTRECSYKECIFPEKSNCSSKIVQGHSIQKSKILEKIAHNGKVMTFDSSKSYSTLDFQEIGIGKASTFFGFCNYHDTKIFSEIENLDYMETPEQNFLHSYRTCARQYVEQRFGLCVHKKMLEKWREKRINMQYYQFMVDEINFDIFLIDNLLNQLEIFHKELIKDHSNRNYHLLFTNIYKLPYSALIAVNSIVDLNNNFHIEIINSEKDLSKRIIPLFLNVFPQNNITFILLSCFSSDKDTFRDLFSLLNSYSIESLENFFSSTIISQCRNFFISPLKCKIFLTFNIRKHIIANLINNMFESYKNNRLPLRQTVNLFQLLKDTS